MPFTNPFIFEKLSIEECTVPLSTLEDVVGKYLAEFGNDDNVLLSCPSSKDCMEAKPLFIASCYFTMKPKYVVVVYNNKDDYDAWMHWFSVMIPAANHSICHYTGVEDPFNNPKPIQNEDGSLCTCFTFVSREVLVEALPYAARVMQRHPLDVSVTELKQLASEYHVNETSERGVAYRPLYTMTEDEHNAQCCKLFSRSWDLVFADFTDIDIKATPGILFAYNAISTYKYTCLVNEHIRQDSELLFYMLCMVRRDYIRRIDRIDMIMKKIDNHFTFIEASPIDVEVLYEALKKPKPRKRTAREKQQCGGDDDVNDDDLQPSSSSASTSTNAKKKSKSTKHLSETLCDSAHGVTLIARMAACKPKRVTSWHNDCGITTVDVDLNAKFSFILMNHSEMDVMLQQAPYIPSNQRCRGNPHREVLTSRSAALLRIEILMQYFNHHFEEQFYVLVDEEFGGILMTRARNTTCIDPMRDDRWRYIPDDASVVIFDYVSAHKYKIDKQLRCHIIFAVFFGTMEFHYASNFFYKSYDVPVDKAVSVLSPYLHDPGTVTNGFNTFDKQMAPIFYYDRTNYAETNFRLFMERVCELNAHLMLSTIHKARFTSGFRSPKVRSYATHFDRAWCKFMERYESRTSGMVHRSCFMTKVPAREQNKNATCIKKLYAAREEKIEKLPCIFIPCDEISLYSAANPRCLEFRKRYDARKPPPVPQIPVGIKKRKDVHKAFQSSSFSSPSSSMPEASTLLYCIDCALSFKTKKRFDIHQTSKRHMNQISIIEARSMRPRASLQQRQRINHILSAYPSSTTATTTLPFSSSSTTLSTSPSLSTTSGIAPTVLQRSRIDQTSTTTRNTSDDDNNSDSEEDVDLETLLEDDLIQVLLPDSMTNRDETILLDDLLNVSDDRKRNSPHYDNAPNDYRMTKMVQMPKELRFRILLNREYLYAASNFNVFTRYLYDYDPTPLCTIEYGLLRKKNMTDAVLSDLITLRAIEKCMPYHHASYYCSDDGLSGILVDKKAIRPGVIGSYGTELQESIDSLIRDFTSDNVSDRKSVV